MSVIIDGVSERESLESALLICFPWGEEPSSNYKALLDSYVQARAKEEGLPVGAINPCYHTRVWKDVRRMADERERRFEEHPFGLFGEILDYLFPPLNRA